MTLGDIYPIVQSIRVVTVLEAEIHILHCENE